MQVILRCFLGVVYRDVRGGRFRGRRLCGAPAARPAKKLGSFIFKAQRMNDGAGAIDVQERGKVEIFPRACSTDGRWHCDVSPENDGNLELE